jgi:DNA-binding XRE family transcriptional regulator
LQPLVVPSCEIRLLNSGAQEVSLTKKTRLATLLRKARLGRNLSVAEIAQKVGVSIAAVYFWEAGRNQPRDDNLKALCRVLELPVQALAKRG